MSQACGDSIIGFDGSYLVWDGTGRLVQFTQNDDCSLHIVGIS